MSKINGVINANGKMTVLGVSKVDEQIVSEMAKGFNNFYDMATLHEYSGNRISELLNVEKTFITANCSSAIAIICGSLLCQDSIVKAQNIYKQQTNKHVILAKGHNVDYGTGVETMVNMGGLNVREVGYANRCDVYDFEQSIDQDTLALMYIKSHHAVQKSMPTIKQIYDLAQKHNLPIIVDAAAEEDLNYIYNLGCDFVIYSGTKSVSGPSSAMILTKNKYYDNLLIQQKGIGRALKVDKSVYFGLVKAVELYVNRQVDSKIQIQICELITKQLEGLTTKIVQDGAGREIYRVQIINEQVTQLANYLNNYEPQIYTRNYQLNNNILELDVRQVSDEEVQIIIQAIKQFYKEG